MKITKSYLKKIIKEQLQEAENDSAEFYLVYDEAGQLRPPKAFISKEEAEKFIEESSGTYDTWDFVIIPMDWEIIKNLRKV